MNEPDVFAPAITQAPRDDDGLVASMIEDGRKPPLPKTAGVKLTLLSDVRAERVWWLWPGRIPLGKLCILDGDPGLGKSTLMLDIAARLTTGAPMPDGARSDLDDPAGVVILTGEDGLGDTIRPRLDAAGADASRVVALMAVPENGADRLPTVCDTSAIEDAIAQVDARLVVVDPLMAYLPGNVDAHRDQDVRRALSLLAELAERTGVAVVCIRHLRKTTGGNPLYRGGGSIGIIGAARAGLLVAPDPDEADGSRRILAATKHNLSAPPRSLAYRLEAGPNGVVKVAWHGETDHNAAQLLAEPQNDEERSALEEAADVLRSILADGPVASREVKRQAREAGIAERTLWRARTLIAAETRKVGHTWEWALPNGTLGTDGRDGRDEENPLRQGDSGKSANSANSAKGTGPGILDRDIPPPELAELDLEGRP